MSGVAFVCLLRTRPALPRERDLKGKRKELQSLKAQLQRRFGAAVAETDHHDLWQRSTLTVALVGGEQADRSPRRADSLQRYVDAAASEDLTRWDRACSRPPNCMDE